MADLTVWKDAGLPTPVEFAPEAMERIRRLAVDGLLSLRRVGMGVGGLLLGRQAGGRISVLDTLPVSCGHAFGPSFRLTAEETIAAARLTCPPDLRIVGLYCSKPRGAAELSAADRALFDAICPETWQIALAVSPSRTEASIGAVFARGRAGHLAGGAPLPIERFDTASPAPVRSFGIEAAPEPVPAPPVEPAPSLGTQPLATRPELARPAEPPVLGEVPLFASPPPRRGAWLKPWLKGAAVALLAIVLCAAAFATREQWMPRPPLDLRSYDDRGRLTVEWNRSAVRGLQTGSLVVTDGSDTSAIPLTGAELHAGTFRYFRRTARVAVVFRAGPLQETTTFRDLSAPARVPAAVPGSVPPDSPPPDSVPPR